MDKKKLFAGIVCLSLAVTGGILMTACGGHEHELTLHDEVAATCTTDGHIKYWKCGDCGKLYTDEKAETEITQAQTVVSAFGHDYEYDYDETNFKYDGVCSHDHTHTDTVNAGASAEFAYQANDAESLTAVLARNSEGKVYIRLTGNINADVVIEEGKDIELDLNGKTLTNVADHTITNSGKVKIVDGSATAGKIDNLTNDKAAVLNYGEIEINDITIERSTEASVDKTHDGGNSFYTIQNFGELVINSGEFKNNGHFSSMITNGWYDGTKNTEKKIAKLTINNGKFVGGLNTIKNDDFGVTVINNGEFTNFTQACVFNVNVLTINGGKIDGSQAEQAIYTKWYNDEYDKGTTTINNGEIIGAIKKANEKSTYTIDPSLEYEVV